MPPSHLTRRIFRRLFRWITDADHPDRIQAADAATLLRRLHWVDDTVPPRGLRERRHQSHKEWYCAKRYLAALTQAQRLHFPLTVHKTESPDFLLEGPNGTFTGLEVTEATTEAFQRELAATEGDGRVHPLGPENGGAGDEPERELAMLVAAAVQAKVRKIAGNPRWQAAARHDLLVYANSPFGPSRPSILVEHIGRLLPPLLAAEAATAWPAGPPGRVSVLTAAVLLHDVTATAEALPLPEAFRTP